MRTFTDATDEVWTIDLTVDLIDRIKAGLGVDFLDPIEGKPSPITRLCTDPRFLVAVIFTGCEEEIKTRELSPEEFAARLNGEAIRRAYDAFMAELKDFFRSLGRKEIVEAVEGSQTIAAKAMELAAERITKLIPSEKKLRAEINRELSKLEKSAGISTGSRGSSGSTRARSR